MNLITSELAALLAPRILKRITEDPETGCWVRSVNVNPATGYTNISRMVNGERTFYYAHRVMYVAHVGPISDGFPVDHMCDNPPCCNPAHLNAGPHRDNVLRSGNRAAINSRKTHCSQGHPLPPFVAGGKRSCAVRHEAKAAI